MSPAEAIALGALQGATEFLPVSSSGHLRLAETALHAQPASVLFDIALHLGTLVAVVVFFWRDLRDLLIGVWPGRGPRWSTRPEVRGLLALLVATIPTAVIGLALEPLVEGPLGVEWVGLALLANGLVLLSTRGRGQAVEASGAGWGIGLGAAALIGVAQGIAVLPGISRSGATIATALLLGVSWRPAAVFSFLLSIPAILGALVLKLGDAGELAGAGASLGLGVATALVVGVACLTVLIGLLRRARFHHFAWYCFALGALAVVWGVAL